MFDLFVAFITGLTTGGLSCLAVQGGLLASSLANQLEKDVAEQNYNEKGKNQAKKHIATPIILFLAAKLAAYTLLGALLGILGSVFQLTPLTRALMQFAIGIFMIGSALRMLNVHPIFRHFAFEPPAFLRRFIRRKASNNRTAILTPLLLGFLTVLIPCGVTQAMMAVAVSTADPLRGAALMFSFVLGTSPVFFVVSYYATKLGSKMEKYFMRTVAIVLLILGLLAIDTGLNLAGSPISATRLSASFFNKTGISQPLTVVQASSVENGPKNNSKEGCGCSNMKGSSKLGESALQPQKPGEPTGVPLVPSETGPSVSQPGAVGDMVTLNVKGNGYEPRVLHAPAGKALQLKLVSNNTYSCSLAFVIPSLNVQKVLQPTGVEIIDIPAQKKGSVMPFSCSMGMYTGQIVFDL
jgi:sulfite exporter TauE/SafE